MVKSLNNSVDLIIPGTSLMGFTEYGDIMIGNNAFEFYHRQDSHKYIQIPWQEIEYVKASVLFKGKWIPRYAIQTKQNGTFIFASKEPKKVLRTINKYVDSQKMMRSLGFFTVLKRALIRRRNKNQ